VKKLTKVKKVPGRLEQLANFPSKATQVAGGKREAAGAPSTVNARDPGVCACAEVPVSGATCAGALRAHCAHTQLICEYVSIYMFLALVVTEVPVLESAMCVCVCVKPGHD
jgi:hypothetical protein